MLFDNFLRQYVQDLIECSSDKYNIPKEDLEDIINTLENNEYLWSILDNAIFEEIDKYRIEESD